MSSYIFDGHKLHYHFERINEYVKKGDCFPLYMEISPVGSCNHRCVFCAYDFIGHPARMLESGRMLKFIDEIAECGVKSLLYSGEGEPLLHPDIDKFIIRSKKNNIDVGVYTNGQFLNEDTALKILPHLTFIRISFNAGTKENYSHIHKVKPEVFDTVVKNIEFAAELKQKKGLSVDIGAQFVLLPENMDYLHNAVNVLKRAGIDYFVIKPFVQQSSRQFYKMQKQFTLSEIDERLIEAEGLSDENFKVLARRDSFKEYGRRGYKRCYGASFISVLNSGGSIASCLPYWDKDDFIFGNIYHDSFKDIWLGKKRADIKRYMENELNVQECPPNCRPNCINEFLWEIKNPTVKHVNFI